MTDAASKKDEGSLGAGIGCLIVLGLIGWAGYWVVHQIWPCDENLVSSFCAKSVLKKGCTTREIESIVNIDYPKDEKGQEVGMAQITYEFRHIPEPGKVASADLMRATTMLYFDKQKKEWLAFCE